MKKMVLAMISLFLFVWVGNIFSQNFLNNDTWKNYLNKYLNNHKYLLSNDSCRTDRPIEVKEASIMGEYACNSADPGSSQKTKGHINRVFIDYTCSRKVLDDTIIASYHHTFYINGDGDVAEDMQDLKCIPEK
jgi:hypothetical protein